jgi:hypothetical protein
VISHSELRGLCALAPRLQARRLRGSHLPDDLDVEHAPHLADLADDLAEVRLFGSGLDRTAVGSDEFTPVLLRDPLSFWSSVEPSEFHLPTYYVTSACGGLH